MSLTDLRYQTLKPKLVDQSCFYQLQSSYDLWSTFSIDQHSGGDAETMHTTSSTSRDLLTALVYYTTSLMPRSLPQDDIEGTVLNHKTLPSQLSTPHAHRMNATEVRPWRRLLPSKEKPLDWFPLPAHEENNSQQCKHPPSTTQLRKSAYQSLKPWHIPTNYKSQDHNPSTTNIRCQEVLTEY